MYIYIYIYTYIYIYIYIYVYICIYTYLIYIHVYKYQTYLYVLYVSMHSNMFLHICMHFSHLYISHMYAYLCVSIHIHTYVTSIHIYVHLISMHISHLHISLHIPHLCITIYIHISHGDANKPPVHNHRCKTSWTPPNGRNTFMDSFVNYTRERYNNFISSTPHNVKPNLPRQLPRALRELSNNTNIVIKEADNGGAITIINKKDYVDDCNLILDNSTY